ncbi:MAG: hypothetical protein PHC60_01740 [Heliobacteriaceae bacterium]|nr:hypothetical protein [Heliobacteriaceae bacterium]MDD4587099.1 hypothetical protein [Heliobacteriaceae bacterium]
MACWRGVLPLLALVFAFCFLGTYTLVIFAGNVVATGSQAVSRSAGGEWPEGRIAPGVAITTETSYTLCRHTAYTTLERPEDWTGRPFRQLRQRFPEREGWQAELRPGQIILRRMVEGLCPVDAARRHLGIVDGVVAVIVGPPGINGGIDRMTRIPAAQLPAVLQELAAVDGVDSDGNGNFWAALARFDDRLGRGEKESPAGVSKITTE